jgi:hypothetical protein
MGALGIHSVEKASIAFDDSDIGFRCSTRQRTNNSLCRHEKGVEVTSRLTHDSTEPLGIDEIRSLLERRHTKAVGVEYRSDAQRYERLAGVTRKSGHDDSW